MKIAIVDDGENWRESIREAIVRQDGRNEMQIEQFASGEEYLGSNEWYDISFIDIEMPGKDGFDTILEARERHPEGIYVILTTHVEMSRKGYVVNAFRYIDKMHLEELEEAITSAGNLLQRNQTITVNVIGDGLRDIVLKNIVYVETEKHYVVMHLQQGSIKCSNTMQEIEDMLPGNCFVRCHNAYIVNLDEIKHLDERIIYLNGGYDIDVSKRRMSQFKKIYLNRQYECVNK